MIRSQSSVADSSPSGRSNDMNNQLSDPRADNFYRIHELDIKINLLLLITKQSGFE